MAILIYVSPGALSHLVPLFLKQKHIDMFCLYRVTRAAYSLQGELFN